MSEYKSSKVRKPRSTRAGDVGNGNGDAGGEVAAAQDIRGIAANTARDLALGLRLASLRMENFEPGQGKDAARELAERLALSARRAVELYYLESLTQAVAITEGPLQIRRQNGLSALGYGSTLRIEQLKSDVNGCYNKVGFVLLLQCELERARRQEVPLSVALFKVEPADSEVAKDVTRHGRDCCRLLDVLATFDERGMAMLLPDTTAEGAQVAAQRVLSSFLAEREIAGRKTDRLRVGVASYPRDGSEVRDLLSRADERAGGPSMLKEPASS